MNRRAYLRRERRQACHNRPQWKPAGGSVRNSSCVNSLLGGVEHAGKDGDIGFAFDERSEAARVEWNVNSVRYPFVWATNYFKESYTNLVLINAGPSPNTTPTDSINLAALQLSATVSIGRPIIDANHLLPNMKRHDTLAEFVTPAVTGRGLEVSTAGAHSCGVSTNSELKCRDSDADGSITNLTVE